MSLCACMGPQGKDPLCPCQMRAAGLTPTPIWTDEKRQELKQAVTEMIAEESPAMAGELPNSPVGARLVPGVMYCAKCDFRLVRTNLYVQNGTTGPGDSKTEPCPNGCGPLWPVTWEQEARERGELLDKQFTEIESLRAELDLLRRVLASTAQEGVKISTELAAAKARLAAYKTPGAEFEVWQDNVCVAGAAGPREQALTETRHYAAQYAFDGPVQVFEVIRVPIDGAS